MVFRLGPFRIDRHARVLYRDGRVVPLTPKAFDTLLVLVDRPGEVVTKEELIRAVWPDTHVEEGSLARNISAIRHALGERRGTAEYIQTIAKVGYRLSVPIAPEAGPAVPPPEATEAGGAPPAVAAEAPVASRARRFAIGGALLVLVGLMVAATALLRGGLAASAGREAAGHPPRAAGAAPEGTKDVRAYQLFLRGQYARERRDREGFDTAKAFFDQALAVDPGFAAAHAAKAEVLLSECWMGWREVAETEAVAEGMLTRALALAPGVASTHAALGLLRWHQWRWKDVERELKQAIALAPGEAKWYDQYAVQYCLPQRRFDEALRLLRRAQGLDPLSRVISAHAASALFYMGRYGEAIAEHRQVLVLEPRFAGSFYGLAQIYAEQRRFDAAEAQYRRTLEFWPDQVAVIAAMGHMWGESGQVARAREALARVEQAPDKAAAAYLRANVHMGLGERDLALDALEEALAARDSHMVWCAIEPDFRPLHGHPRFTRILRAVGLDVPN